MHRHAQAGEDDKLMTDNLSIATGNVPKLALPEEGFLEEDMYDLLPLFARQNRQSVGEIKEAFAKGDFTEAKRVLHKAKGSSATYGFSDLSKYYASLEDAVLRQDQPRPEWTAHLDEWIEAIDEGMKKLGVFES